MSSVVKIDMYHVEPGVQIQVCAAPGVTLQDVEEAANRQHPMGDMLWKKMQVDDASMPCESNSGHTHYLLTPDGRVRPKIVVGKDGVSADQIEKLVQALGASASIDPDPSLTSAPDDRHIRALYEMVLRKEKASFDAFEAEAIALTVASCLRSKRLMFRHAGAAKVLDPVRFDQKPSLRMGLAQTVAIMVLVRQFGAKSAKRAKEGGLTEDDIQAIIRIVSVVMMAEVFYSGFNLPDPALEQVEAEGAKFGRVGYVAEE